MRQKPIVMIKSKKTSTAGREGVEGLAQSDLLRVRLTRESKSCAVFQYYHSLSTSRWS